MIKRLLLLLCLTLTAGSAAWANIAQGTFKNGGSWKITDQGELYIDATTVPDYESSTSTGTNAPWISYRQCIQNIRFSSKVQTIGRNAFAHLSYLRKVTFDNQTSANVSLGAAAFNDCCSLREFDFTYVSVIGAYAFDHCDLRFVQLPAITWIDDYAFAYNAKMMIPSTGFAPSIIISSSAKPTLSTYALSHRSISNTYTVDIYDGSQYVRTEERVSWQNAYYPLYVDANGDIKQSSQPIDLNKYKYVVSVPAPMYDNVKSTESAMSAAGVHINFAQGGLLPVTSNTDIPAYWIFTTDRLVVYTGGMPMPDYNSASDVPWNALRDKIQFAELQVTAVGRNALKGCPLRRIEMSTDTKEIHDFAFANCTPTNNGSYMRPLDLKNVEAVGASAFSNSSFFVEADLPKVTTVGASAFTGCRIEKLTLGTYLANIGTRAFANNGLKNSAHIYVFCKAPVTASDAFEGVSQGNIRLHVPAELSNGYSTSPWSSFYLDRIVDFPVIGYVPAKWELTADGTLTIGATYWDGIIPDYENITDQPWFPYRELIRKIKFIGAVKTIGKNAFAFEEPGKSVINSIEAKDVKFIGENAFLNNNMLTSFTSDEIQTIGDRAFAGCTNIKDYKFGSNLKSIGKNAFDGCTNVDVMALTAANPPEVTAETFKGMGASSGSQSSRRRAAGTGQKSVTLDVPDAYLTKYLANPYWRLFSFYAGEYGRIVSSGNFGDGLWVLYDNGTMVVSADKGPGNTYAEGSAQALGFGSSSDSNSPINLTKRVEFMGNITHLGWGFQYFPNLESVQLCPSIMRLDDTFEGCPKLTGINLENVDTIGDWTFARSGVKDIQLPRVSYIGRGAFYKCQQLQTVSLGSTCEIREQAFFYCDKMTDINLADAQLDAASQCFSSCYKLKNVTFNGTYLPSNIFSNCFDLASIDLGSRVDSISFDAFYGCNALNTVYCANPTPPAMPWGKRKVGDEYYDAQAFFGRNLQNIHLYLPASIVLPYRKADVWKGMTIETDLRYTEDLLPTGGSIGDKGTWYIDTNGTLTLDFEGYAWQSDLGGVKWHDLLAPWVPFLTGVVVSDRVKWVPTDMTGEHNPEWSADVTSVELGTHVTEVNSGSLNYSGLRDVYCYAESCPIVRETGFDWEAITANNATLHVVTSEGVLGRYQNSKMWSRFPNIVADLPSRLPAGVFHATSADGLEIWYRVTDETARTCETFVNDIAGCAVENNSYKQYDKLTIPETANYNGTAYTVTAIGDNSFYGCTNFATFILPETIERIGVNAFNYCFSVHEFTLPASVKYIGENAFEMWVNIERMTVNGQVPPAVSDNFINTYWDPDMRPKPVLLVPEGCRDAWNVAPWNEWFNVYDPYNKSMLVYKVKPGTEFYNYYQNDEEYMCIEGLKALELIHFENELVDRVWDPDAYFWEEVWGDVYYNKAGKKLFYIGKEDEIQIYDGVGPADNIYYEFKAEDFETMMYTTGRNVDLYKGLSLVFPETNVQTDIYFTATNAEGIDITYRVLDEQKKTCEVKADPNGYGSNAVSSDVSDVKVPFEAGGYVVTGIAADAFDSMSGLQVVTLPASIRNIGANAFGYCENVVAVYMECAAPPMLLDQDGFLTVENNMAFENIGVPAGTDMGGAMLYVPYGSEDAYDVYPWNYWFSSSIQADPDGIEDIDHSPLTIEHSEDAWFDLSGRKLGSKPTKAGLYINNGRKVVVK